jgi:hypothetical protein
MLTASILDIQTGIPALVAVVVLVLVILFVGRYLDGRRAALPVPKYALEQYAKTDSPSAPAVPGQERRRYPRHRSALVCVDIQLTGEEELLEGWVVDYSQGGVRLMTERAIAVGQFIKLRAHANANGEWLSVEVRHCHIGPGKWNLGCMFLEMVHWDQVKQFCS